MDWKFFTVLQYWIFGVRKHLVMYERDGHPTVVPLVGCPVGPTLPGMAPGPVPGTVFTRCLDTIHVSKYP